MKTEFVIVTGISGAGKSCAVNVMEDIGYFCIDNMPPQLIPKFAEICEENDDISKVAIVYRHSWRNYVSEPQRYHR